MSPVNRHNGFSLTELMVAMTITTLVTGSTVTLLRSSTAARNRVARQMQLQQEARTAVNTIATALRNAYRSPDGQIMLVGADDSFGQMPADRVRFFAISRQTIRPDQPESDVKECEFLLILAPQAGASQLPALMRRTDPTRNEEPDDGGVLERLADNVLGLNLAYHDGVDWRLDWPKDTKGWPVAIRIDLVVLAESAAKSFDPNSVDPAMLAESQWAWRTSRIVNFPRRAKPDSGGEE